jgi:hypothetical protein
LVLSDRRGGAVADNHEVSHQAANTDPSSGQAEVTSDTSSLAIIVEGFSPHRAHLPAIRRYSQTFRFMPNRWNPIIRWWNG